MMYKIVKDNEEKVPIIFDIGLQLVMCMKNFVKFTKKSAIVCIFINGLRKHCTNSIKSKQLDAHMRHDYCAMVRKKQVFLSEKLNHRQTSPSKQLIDW